MSAHPSVRAMWRAFLKAGGRQGPEAPPSVFHFCDLPEDADDCARLVLGGKKTATAPSLWEIEAAGDPMPAPGDLHVVTDHAGEAVCVIETVSAGHARFCDVTAEHAAAEGEGDGSLAYWRAVHEAYYRRVLAGTGYAFSEDMPILLERFHVVFPTNKDAAPSTRGA